MRNCDSVGRDMELVDALLCKKGRIVLHDAFDADIGVFRRNLVLADYLKVGTGPDFYYCCTLASDKR